MFIPTTDAAHDTSYFMSRYVWNPEEENVHGGSDFDDFTDSYSGSSSSFLQDEEVISSALFSLYLCYSACMVQLSLAIGISFI